MKKLLFVITALALFSCTKDVLNDSRTASGIDESAKIISTPDGAIAGVLNIEVTPELADRIEAANSQTSRSGEGVTRSGISDMDLVFNKIGVEHFTRTFPYEEKYEARHRAFGLHLWYTLKFDTAEQLTTAAKLLSEVSGISTVEYRHRKVPMNRGRMIPYNKANAQAQTRASLPMNDPELAAQWHYNNTGTVGATINGNRFYAKAGADIDLFEAWALCTGSPEIIVAVIDEPVQYTHPDLEANIWTNPNPGTTGTYKNDIHGFNFYNQTGTIDWKSSYYNTDYKEWEYADHGSHVAGTIAAVNGNGIGVCGIAGGTNGGNGVKIMVCQIMGYGTSNVDQDGAAKAFVYAADRGALIAQCSWGYDTNISTQTQWEKNDKGAEKKAIDYFIANAGADAPNSPLKGGLVIFAAGNDGDTVGDQMMWPGAYSPTIAVSSMAPDYTPAYYTDFGKWADITAPGGDEHYGNDGEGMVLSTVLEDPDMSFMDGRTEAYGYMQGTSMACPHISGIAALGLSYAAKLGKQYSLSEFKTMLLSSVNDINIFMTGSKKFINIYGGWSTMNIGSYKQKMGSGYADAYKMLLEIKGTPSIYMQQNKSTEIDLTNYFGAGAAYATFTVDLPGDVKTKLGVSTPTVNAGKLTLSCSKCGGGTITVKTTIGETAISKEIALLVRESVASNGGWL